MFSRSGARRLALGVVIGVCAMAGACTAEPGGAGAPRPTPPPSFVGFGAASHADLVAYCNSLVFDSLAPHMDSARFATSGGVSLVRAEPEIGAARVSRSGLAQGRIIGRLVTTGAPSPFPTRVGTTCIGVDSTAGGGWRVTRIPTDTPSVVGGPIRMLPFNSGDSSYMRMDGGKLYALGSCNQHICPLADSTTTNCYWDEAQQAWVCITLPPPEKKKVTAPMPVPRGSAPARN
jgi:hypothetical protein